ncbi:TrbI/VirB10 family protein [Sphingopyxis panaciterrae]
MVLGPRRLDGGHNVEGTSASTLNSNWFDTGPKANTRFLSDEEIGWLFRAFLEEEPVYRRGFILLLLSAARRSELFDAPADEVVAGVWTLPPERSQNNEENVVASARADKVDFHSWALLKGVGLARLLGVGTELGFGSDESELVRAMRESAQTGGARAGDRIVERNLDIPPTIRVRLGWLVRVIVRRDLVLAPWSP